MCDKITDSQPGRSEATEGEPESAPYERLTLAQGGAQVQEWGKGEDRGEALDGEEGGEASRGGPPTHPGRCRGSRGGRCSS